MKLFYIVITKIDFTNELLGPKFKETLAAVLNFGPEMDNSMPQRKAAADGAVVA